MSEKPKRDIYVAPFGGEPTAEDWEIISAAAMCIMDILQEAGARCGPSVLISVIASLLIEQENPFAALAELHQGAFCSLRDGLALKAEDETAGHG